MKQILLILILLVLMFLVLSLPLAGVEASSLAQAAQEGKAIFQQKCSSCHTIGGGKLVGPDLQGVTARRDAGWLKRFIAAPDKMFAAEDPLALQLLAENNNIPMPALGLKDSEVAAILAYLEDPSAAPPDDQTSAVALPEGRALAGQNLFTGEARLANGGPPCLACHTVSGYGWLEGGRLGPDLTQVIQRYGEAGLAANLNQITFPTMQGPFLNRPFTPQEQADLIAFFTWSNAQATQAIDRKTPVFLGIGAFGSLFLFGILAVFWPQQRENLATRLRRQSRRKG